MKQTRQQKRGLYERKRRNKFRYLKNTDQMDNYYSSKEKKKVKNSIKRSFKKPVIKKKVSWYQKIINYIK